jgi:hypothetical protein
VGQCTFGLVLRYLLYALAVFLLAGCGGADDSTGVETKTTSAGATTYDVASAGFSIAVPESWRTISADEFAEGGKWESVITETPALAPYAEAFQGSDSVLKFAAVDPRVQDDFATNLNVIVEELSADATLDDYEEAFISQLQGLPNVVGTIDRQRVELPAGPALRASYKLRLLTAGRTLTVSVLQYALVDEGRAFILTYTTLPARATAYEDTFTRSAESFRLT